MGAGFPMSERGVREKQEGPCWHSLRGGVSGGSEVGPGRDAEGLQKHWRHVHTHPGECACTEGPPPPIKK